jgi:AcrR family transcriptional regulator
MVNPALTEKPGVRTRRPVGRPRDPAVQEAILRATAAALSESGYARLTIEGVAQRAGVTRKSIYRRWPTKLELVTELFRTASRSAPLPDTGSLRGDLIGLYRLYAKSLATPGGPIIPALVSESMFNEELAAIISTYNNVRRSHLIRLFERAVARGEMVAPKNPDIFIDAISGFFWFRKMIRRAAIRENQAEAFADFLLSGISRRVRGR